MTPRKLTTTADADIPTGAGGERDAQPHVRSDWSEWSQERERKKIEHEIALRAAAAGHPVYPRELAERIADDFKKQVPDWRLMRPEVAGLFTKIVKMQPEWQQREIQQREQMIKLIADNLPKHIRPLVRDVQVVFDLLGQAREAAAYLVGYCTGRKAEKLRTDATGRLRTSVRRSSGLAITFGPPTPDPPPSPSAPVTLPDEGLSLQDIERLALIAALQKTDWSQARAAELLHLSGAAMNAKIKRHRIEYPPEVAHLRRRGKRPRQFTELATDE